MAAKKAKKPGKRESKTRKPANKAPKSATSRKVAQPASTGRIAKLEAMVARLRASLAAEIKRREVDQRLLTEAKRGRDVVGRQITALREQGTKLALQIKSAAQESRTLDEARRAALAKVEKLRVELHTKSEEVRRTSAELAKLAWDSAARAREITHSRGLAMEPLHQPEIENEPLQTGSHDRENVSGDLFSSGKKPQI